MGWENGKTLMPYIEYLTAELSTINLPHETRMAWYQFRGQAYHELFTFTQNPKHLELAAINDLAAIDYYFPFLDKLLLESQRTSSLLFYLDSKHDLTLAECYILFVICVQQGKVALARHRLLALSQFLLKCQIPANLGHEFFITVFRKEFCGLVLNVPFHPELISALKTLLISFITDRVTESVVKQNALCQCLLRNTYLGSIVTSQQGMRQTSVASGSMHDVANLLWREFQAAGGCHLDGTTRQLFLADTDLQKDLKIHHRELWRFLDKNELIAHQVVTDIFSTKPSKTSNVSSSVTVYSPDDEDYDPEVAKTTLGK